MLLPDLDRRFAYSAHEIEGEMVWVLAVRWYRYPFALVDEQGVGHDDKQCRLIHRGETLDALMARDAWPCKSCVQMPPHDALHGSFGAVGATGGPNPPRTQQGAVQQAQGPKERLAAVFGTV